MRTMVRLVETSGKEEYYALDGDWTGYEGKRLVKLAIDDPLFDALEVLVLRPELRRRVCGKTVTMYTA